MRPLSYKRLFQLAIDFMEVQTKDLINKGMIRDRESIKSMGRDLKVITEYLGFVMKNNK